MKARVWTPLMRVRGRTELIIEAYLTYELIAVVCKLQDCNTRWYYHYVVTITRWLQTPMNGNANENYWQGSTPLGKQQTTQVKHRRIRSSR